MPPLDYVEELSTRQHAFLHSIFTTLHCTKCVMSLHVPESPPPSPTRFGLIINFWPLHSKIKEGIKQKMAKSATQGEKFNAVVAAQRQLSLFHAQKGEMQLRMDRSHAVLMHLRREKIQARWTQGHK